MTEFQTASLALAAASLAAQLLIGAGQIGIVWWGIRAMVRANSERALAAAQDRQDRAAELDRRDLADQRRHEEVMAHLEAQARAMERQGLALETLIERTA